MLGDVVGASMGTEFMAYLDEDIQVKATPAEETPAPAPPPAAVPAKPVEVTPTPAATTTPAVTNVPTPAETAPQAAQPVESAPPVRAAAEAAQPAPAAPPVTQTPQPLAPAGQQPAGAGERVTVECFSDPTGADILIDGSFYGSTPSILKLTAAAHHLEISMQGYKNYVQDLDMSGERGLRTIRAPLEKKEQE
jgi:cytoskeletal protein RodZ